VQDRVGNGEVLGFMGAGWGKVGAGSLGIGYAHQRLLHCETFWGDLRFIAFCVSGRKRTTLCVCAPCVANGEQEDFIIGRRRLEVSDAVYRLYGTTAMVGTGWV
jgi:hypothetical protein